METLVVADVFDIGLIYFFYLKSSNFSWIFHFVAVW